jgi:hypothetical protein
MTLTVTEYDVLLALAALGFACVLCTFAIVALCAASSRHYDQADQPQSLSPYPTHKNGPGTAATVRGLTRGDISDAAHHR